MLKPMGAKCNYNFAFKVCMKASEII
uniref:Uncharacterized protein n=1 Tax=Anguilla anguilla TaxID=7936 RepID=A0A0E9V2W9_ANGAN